MKKYVIYLFLFMFLPLAAMAQLRINMRGEALRKLQIAEMAINNL